MLISYDKLSDANGLDSLKEGKIARVTAEGLDIIKLNAGRSGGGGSGGGKINVDSGDGVLMYWRMYEGA